MFASRLDLAGHGALRAKRVQSRSRAIKMAGAVASMLLVLGVSAAMITNFAGTRTELPPYLPKSRLSSLQSDSRRILSASYLSAKNSTEQASSRGHFTAESGSEQMPSNQSSFGSTVNDTLRNATALSSLLFRVKDWVARHKKVSAAIAAALVGAIAAMVILCIILVPSKPAAAAALVVKSRGSNQDNTPVHTATSWIPWGIPAIVITILGIAAGAGIYAYCKHRPSANQAGSPHQHPIITTTIGAPTQMQVQTVPAPIVTQVLLQQQPTVSAVSALPAVNRATDEQLERARKSLSALKTLAKRKRYYEAFQPYHKTIISNELRKLLKRNEQVVPVLDTANCYSYLYCIVLSGEKDPLVVLVDDNNELWQGQLSFDRTKHLKVPEEIIRTTEDYHKFMTGLDTLAEAIDKLNDWPPDVYGGAMSRI